MTGITIRGADEYLRHYAELLEKVKRENPVILPRIVNQVGNRAKTIVIRNLTAQTGLPRKTIVVAVGNSATARATGRLSYEITTRGGFIRLKYLAPREPRQGVVAKPFSQPRLFAGAFMRGGQWPRRVAVQSFGGHVMQRMEKAGCRLTQVRSQVRIPHEMTVGATKAAFERTAAPLLRERVEAMLIMRFGR
jgi:ribosomal protein L18E